MQYIDKNSQFVIDGNTRDVRFKICQADSFQTASGSVVAPKRSPTTITFGPIGSDADYEFANNVDIGPTINGVLANDTTLFFFQGDYHIATTIDMSNYSRLVIKGEDEQRTRFYTLAGVSAIKAEFTPGDANDKFDNILRDFSLFHGARPNGTATGNTGTYAISIGKHKSMQIQNVCIRYFDEGIKLVNEVFYLRVLNCKIQDCSTYSVYIGNGADDRCNSNFFSGCQFIGSVGVPTITQVFIQEGNENNFTGCVFENWSATGVTFADDANCESNMIVGGRMESNLNTVGTQYAVYFGDACSRNFIMNPYISGSDNDIDAYINYNASVGNCVEAITFKGSQILKERSLLTAGDFAEYKRSGSGDGASVLTVRDTYINSGTPEGTLRVDGARPVGKLIRCDFKGDERYNLTGEGKQTNMPYVDLGAPKASFEVITIDPELDGANTLSDLNYMLMKNPTLLDSAVLTEAHVIKFDANGGTHPAVDGGTTKSTPTSVQAWMKMNLNGATVYVPCYSSKTA